MEPEPLSYWSDEERYALCLSKGIDPAQHCCLDMAWFISEPEESPQGPNPIMLWIDAWNEYRINIPRLGNSSVVVSYCPWCGQRLPGSLRVRWYETLHQMGYMDPGEEEIPKEFDSDAWWRRADVSRPGD